jgi:outer membrane protein assembly factor BamB
MPLALVPSAAAQSHLFWSESRDSGSGLDEQATDVALGPQGQVFVAGWARNALDSDAHFLAYDAFGKVLWEQRIDLGSDEVADRLVFDPSSEDLYAIGNGSPSHWLIWRIDGATGAVSWQEVYLGPQLQGGVATGLALDDQGGVAVSGAVGSGVEQVAFLARFDGSGALTWELPLAVPGGEEGLCAVLVEDSNGDLLLRSSAVLPAKGTQGFLHKVTSAGSLVWSLPIGGPDDVAQGPAPDAAGNFVVSINQRAPRMNYVAKLDSQGHRIWSVDSLKMFLGPLASVVALAVDADGDVLATGSKGRVARLAAQDGAILWTQGLPFQTGWYEYGGVPAGMALNQHGDVFVRYRVHTPFEELELDAVAGWNAGGELLWSQSVRGLDPQVEVRTFGLAAAPGGSVVLAGMSQPIGEDMDGFVAALHASSRLACFGDGSSGPCPCGANVVKGTPSGCVTDWGEGGRLDDQGISSLGSDSVRFCASVPGQSLSNGLAVLLQGRHAGTAVPFEDGLLCLERPIVRLYATIGGSSSLDLPPAGAPSVHLRSAELGDPILPGTRRAYQMYFRSQVTGTCHADGGNFTNSVIVDWEL